MRLLYVIDSLAPGGAETSLAEMAPYLVAQGVDLHVLPLGSRLDLAERLEKGGAVVHRVDAATGRVGNVRTVLDSMRAVRPTLVHTTLFEADVAGRTAARLRRVPVSTSLVSDSYSPAHRAESPAMRIALARAVDATTARFATRFHAISGAVADAVAPRLGLRRSSSRSSRGDGTHTGSRTDRREQDPGCGLRSAWPTTSLSCSRSGAWKRRRGCGTSSRHFPRSRR